MYYEIYLDVVFIMNFMFDFIIVKVTGNIAKRKSTLFRCILAATLSSCILCFIYIFGMNILLKYYFIMMLIMNAATVFIVFYRKRTKINEIISLLVIYYTISFVLGGLINLICINTDMGYYLFTVPWWRVCIVGIMVMILIRPIIMYIEKCNNKKYVHHEVEITLGDKTVRVDALLDTGNHLCEPMSQKPVHVVEMPAVSQLFAESFLTAVKQYYESGAAESGLYLERGIRMVPFRAVGTPQGKLLVAVMADVMRVKNKAAEYEEKGVYIALYDGKLAGDGSYKMLLHSKGLIRERS